MKVSFVNMEPFTDSDFVDYCHISKIPKGNAYIVKSPDRILVFIAGRTDFLEKNELIVQMYNVKKDYFFTLVAELSDKVLKDIDRIAGFVKAGKIDQASVDFVNMGATDEW